MASESEVPRSSVNSYKARSLLSYLMLVRMKEPASVSSEVLAQGFLLWQVDHALYNESASGIPA